MTSVHLFRGLMHAYAEVGLRLTRPQSANLAMLCQALALSSDCHLNNLALELPVAAQRESLVQRLRRFLKHAPSWEEGYRPLVRHLFEHWNGVDVALVMDRTDLANRQSILTLGAAYGHRLLPLVWQIDSFGGTGAKVQIALLRKVQPLLPAGRRVIFFGDGEFRSLSVQAFCRDQGWHWHVGLKSDLTVHTDSEGTMTLIDLPIGPRSGPIYRQNVRLGACAFGPVNILARWSPRHHWPRFWATDLPANRRAWRRGRKRFWCEPTFRDWKSYGFDLERTHLIHAERVEALILAMAITTLWLIHLGVCVRTSSRRSLLEPPHSRDYSLFRLGRDYLQRARIMHWPMPIGFTVRHPAPA